MTDLNTETATDTPNAVEESNAVAPETILTSEVKEPEAVEAKTEATPEPKVEEPKEAKTVVPEKYELKLPEGSLLDASAIEKAAAMAKASGLSNEQAQKLLEHESNSIASFIEGQKQQLKQTSESWARELSVDKEFGGADFEKNAELAKRVVHKFASDGFRKTLNETGLGNHPDLVRTFVRIGKAMSEDKLVLPGSPPANVQKRHEDVLYPESNKGEK